ncbi:hypothetical protein D3C87_1554400 [compost metagenome]
MGQDHAQVQQHIGDGVPLRVSITAIVSVQYLLDFADALPDPNRCPRLATEKIRGDVEQCPATVAQQRPAPFCVG